MMKQQVIFFHTIRLGDSSGLLKTAKWVCMDYTWSLEIDYSFKVPFDHLSCTLLNPPPTEELISPVYKQCLLKVDGIVIISCIY